jgi:hypothetical protein
LVARHSILSHVHETKERRREMNRQFLLKVVLWSICVYHVFLGVGAFLSESWAVRLADAVFGMTVQPTPQLSYIVKLLGVYALVFGLMAGIAAREPRRHLSLLNVIVLLYVCRFLNKVFQVDLFTAAFDASPQRTWLDVALLAAFGAAVFFLKPRGTTAE